MSPWATYPIEQSLGAAALALLAALVARRGTSPRVARGLWLLVLVKLVTPPVWRLAEPTADLAATVLAHAASLHDDPRRALAARGALADALVATWLVGSALVAASAVAGAWRFRRLAARGRPASAALVEEVAVLARRAGLAAPPRTRLVDACLPPCVAGPFRPTLVLPTPLLARLSPTQRRLVLGHELMHLAGRDPWVRLLEGVVLVAWWWNPLAWIASAQLRRWEERARDAALLEAFPRGRRPYAEALVDTLDFLAEGARGVLGEARDTGTSDARGAAAALTGRGGRRRARSEVGERLVAVVRGEPHRGSWTAGLLAAVVVALLAGPSLGEDGPRTVFASDAAGPFQLVFDGDRVRGVAVGGRVLDASRWHQTPAALDVLAADGALEFRIALHDDRITWDGRPSSRPGDTP